MVVTGGEDMITIMSGIEYPDELLEMLQPGNSFWMFVNSGNRKNKLIHILAIIEDEQIVYKFWLPSKGWIYHIEWIYTFLGWYKEGWLI